MVNPAEARSSRSLRVVGDEHRGDPSELLGHLAASAGKGNIRWFPGGLLALLIAPFLGLPGMVALLVMAAAAWLVGRRAKALLGGQTGDVLGTVQLCSEIAGWVVLNAVGQIWQTQGLVPEMVTDFIRAEAARMLLITLALVSVIAAASAASTAFPPRRMASSPACAARGCDVATTRRA